jgi:hypothetical protein
MWNIKTIHKRDEGGTVAIELETMDRRFDVNVRWDGCMELHSYQTTEEGRELSDTLHTCDLRGLVEVLQSLDEICQGQFGEGSYWTEGAAKIAEVVG